MEFRITAPLVAVHSGSGRCRANSYGAAAAGGFHPVMAANSIRSVVDTGAILITDHILTYLPRIRSRRITIPKRPPGFHSAAFTRVPLPA